jgi:zinc protease
MKPQKEKNKNEKRPQVRPESLKFLTSVEGINEYQLTNGLRVLIFPDQSVQTITVNITYLVGSRNESYGETGMAHLLEHLLFKGTPGHSNIPQELTEHGANANGTTFYDRTNYYETFAVTEENLNWALSLEADRMINSFVAKKDLDSEMTVVRNEMERNENDPGRILMERVMSAAYVWHNYGKSVIGARADVENVPIERLQAFYKTYYQPDNAVLIVSGKIDESRVLELIDKYFAPIPRPERKLPNVYTVEPVQEGERSVILRRGGDTQLINLAYHIPAFAHSDFAALLVLFDVLGNAPSGRLYKALVVTKKASSVWASGFRLKDPSLAYISAEVRKEDSIQEATDALLETIENFNSQKLLDEEVERARTALLNGFEQTLSSSTKTTLELNECIARGDWRLFFITRDRLRQVTPEQVRQAAAKYLIASNRTLGTFLPIENPVRAAVGQVTESELSEMVKGYKGDETFAAGEAFDPTPENIEARVYRTTTKDGLSLALLPKKTRNEIVHATLILRFGDEKSLRNRGWINQFVGAMLMRGTTQHTREQLQETFNRLKASVWIDGANPSSATVSLKTTRANLPEVLQLVVESLRSPSFPVNEFETLKEEIAADLESGKSDPGMIGERAFRRHLKPYQKGDVRYTPAFEEELEQIQQTTIENVKKFYADFYGASNAQLGVVGDFDETEISKLAEDLLENWHSSVEFERVIDDYHEAEPVNLSMETPDKSNAVFYAGLNLKVSDNSPDYAAILLGNFMIGGGFLNSRLAVRIRQKEGLSYSVNSRLLINSLDESGNFRAFAIFAPENLPKLETAFQEEIERIVETGFTAEEIEAAKTGYLLAQATRRSQDNELSFSLANHLYLDRTFAREEKLEQKIKSLTPEQINSAVKKHLEPSKITVVKAGDFKKAGLTPIE